MTQEIKDLLAELEAYVEIHLEREARTIIMMWIDEKRDEAEDIHNDSDLSGRI